MKALMISGVSALDGVVYCLLAAIYYHQFDLSLHLSVGLACSAYHTARNMSVQLHQNKAARRLVPAPKQ